MNYTLLRSGDLVSRRTEPPGDVADRLGPDIAPRGASRLPCGWVRDGGLRSFRSEPAHAGRSAAALKILLAVALMAEADEAGPEPVAALLSYAQLTALAGLSSPVLSAGKRLLTAQGLIAVTHEGQGRRVRYRLTDAPGPPRYARIAHAPLDRDAPDLRIADLHRFTSRYARDLNALKLYVLLAALADRRGTVQNLSCADIAARTNMSETKAREAIECLDAEGLARARETDFRLVPGRIAHSFTIRPLR
ncbi:hypothetical protein [Methylobacterium planeticum]|uniref:Helix-turn-helix domain-containing protein n=1 Tax=Methylobacterium planeticum TaxID=2615211 RepID=A0A6N6MIG5_9HYPH|nr:hypothetical protein [Methylobacterium planeticum]KAB1070210.1 hypothetical protein F6X51_23285 [Methylobacterium planeticum]